MHFRLTLGGIAISTSLGMTATAEGVLLGGTGIERVRSADGDHLLIQSVPAQIPAPTGNARIGIIDSGILSEHPQLSAAIKESKGFTEESVEDASGHGTLVALQVIASNYSPDIVNTPYGGDENIPWLYVAKVTRQVGAAHIPDVDAVIEAIAWLSELDVLVVNLSLGFTEFAPIEDRERLCAAMREHDLLYSVADTNDPDSPVWPASCSNVPNMIVVGEHNQSTGQVTASEATDILAPSGTLPISPFDYQLSLAYQHMQAGRLDEAHQALVAAADLEENADLFIALSELNARYGNWTEALKAALVAERLAPDNWRPLFQIALAQLEFGNNQEALEATNAAERNGGAEVASVYHVRFVAAARLGLPDIAEAALARVALLDPEYPYLADALATFRDWQGRDITPLEEGSQN